MPKTDSSGKNTYNLRSKPKDNLKSSGDDGSPPEQLDPEEYQKLLAKLYPSTFQSNKVEEIKKQSQEDEESDDEETLGDEDTSDDESSEEESSDEDSGDDEDDGNKINIVFQITGLGDESGTDDDSEDEDSDYETEEDDELVAYESYEEFSKKELREEIRERGIKCKDMKNKKKMIRLLEKSDEEDAEIPYEEYTKKELRADLKGRGLKIKDQYSKKSMIKQLEKNDIKMAEEEEEEEEEIQKNFKKTKSPKPKNKKEVDAANALLEMKEGKKERLTDDHVLDQFRALAEKLTEKDKDNKLVGKARKHVEEMEKIVEANNKKREKKDKAKNMKTFKKMMKGKTLMDDGKYFETLTIAQQNKIIEEFEKVNDAYKQTMPYRFQILESNIPETYKHTALAKINTLRHMSPGEGEYYKLKYWVDGFMKIPFDKTNTLPLSITDGIEKTHEYMANAKQILDEAVYGLEDAKMQIMQMIGQLLTNPKSVGTAIAIKGPMGTGKTTLVREGISKILQRPFAFIALGGATDSSFLEGHSYTYEGSTWGKIVEILMKSRCMNPVFFFDELDKVSDTPKGEEIIGILTHLTDTSQNCEFHDKYFSDVHFDLSKALFIFSYNDEDRINPILRDRMYRIQTQGYETKDKQIISNQYLIPNVQQNVNMDKGNIIITDEIIKHMIEKFTDEEKGVRNLKRCIEIIYTKLNLYRLMKPDTKLFKDEMSLDVQFPFTVTTEIVDKLVKINDNESKCYLNFYL